MAGRFEKRELDLADVQFVAVFNFVRRKLRIRPLAIDDLGARFGGKLDVPADKIGVRMRFDNVFYLLAVRRGFVDVLLDVTLRIDDRGLAVRAEIIRRVRETAEIKLPKKIITTKKGVPVRVL